MNLQPPSRPWLLIAMLRATKVNGRQLQLTAQKFKFVLLELEC